MTGCSSRSRWRTGGPRPGLGLRNEAQVIALIDGWITALVRQRSWVTALQLHFGLIPGFGIGGGFGIGLGIPLDPGGVVAGGQPFGLLLHDALGGLFGLC